MKISCPHCADRAITRTSKRPAPVFYEVYAQCINPDCGWAGKLHIEFATTTAPSRKPNAAVRIPIEPASRRVLLEQLTAQHS
ncbi:ogr/Delta-like zinc finger family protein [Billgrantia montanilacus]|uniref:ogr/Delta-like zinc finger family protein n=1 Tax=Billgrantia montanilacus TaxID=2282305 RepID=UPI0015F079ED|nr:ogr/Delta-like zinc finger family protein [Halomonas montanilacus]